MRIPPVLWIGLLVVLATALALLLCACDDQPTTRIDPQSIQQSASFSDTGPATTTLKIQPAIPASQPSTTVTLGSATPTTRPGSTITIGADTISVPAGSGVEYTHATAAATTTSQQGSAAGATYKSNGPVQGDWNQAPPTLTFGKIDTTGPNGRTTAGSSSGSGGATEFTWLNEVLAAVSTPGSVKFLGWAGVALIAGGILMIVIEHLIGGVADWALFALIELAGVGLLMLSIVITDHPWLFLLFFVALLGGIAWYVIYWKKKSTVVATTTTTTTTPPATPAVATPDLVQRLEAAVKNLVIPQAGVAKVATTGQVSTVTTTTAPVVPGTINPAVLTNVAG